MAELANTLIPSVYCRLYLTAGEAHSIGLAGLNNSAYNSRHPSFFTGYASSMTDTFACRQIRLSNFHRKVSNLYSRLFSFSIERLLALLLPMPPPPVNKAWSSPAPAVNEVRKGAER